MRHWDYAIGNPPYMQESLGQNDTYAPQVYNKFLDAAYEIADTVEMIHPGRFLFDAGSTPKEWNRKMLNDPHLKILHYESDAKKLFPNTAITGGIAISYRSNKRNYGAIGIFTAFEQLNDILHKVTNHTTFQGLDSIVITRTIYRLTEKMHQDHPEALKQLSKGHAYDMSSNIFDRLPQIFYETLPNDGFQYIRMLGRIDRQRTYRYIRRDYVNNVVNMNKYKVVLARADGASGTIGNPVPARILGNSVIEKPGTGTTESFLSIGSFEHENEVFNLQKYIKTRFARTLLSVLKTTQDITPEKFKYVPLQDFTPNSDIDWSKSIADIDQQLYKKYELSDEEIQFIETHVKEME